MFFFDFSSDFLEELTIWVCDRQCTRELRGIELRKKFEQSLLPIVIKLKMKDVIFVLRLPWQQFHLLVEFTLSQIAQKVIGQGIFDRSSG